jgi:crotonobetainyl-CoA hydratase
VADEVLYEKREHYAIMTLNRPQRLNAQDQLMRHKIEEFMDDFDSDPNMRAGILTGAGRAFSAGMDLQAAAERADRGQSVTNAAPRSGSIPRLCFSQSPRPWIAAINGLAIGGGLERALDCDIRIISSEAYVGLYEVRRGLLPGYATHHLPRVISVAAASQVLLLGERVNPEQALQWGIVTEILEPDRLMPRAIEMAETVARNAPLPVQGAKSMIQSWRMAKIDDSYRLAEWLSKPVMESEDIKEGARAFAEKRDPVWKGR